MSTHRHTSSNAAPTGAGILRGLRSGFTDLEPIQTSEKRLSLVTAGELPSAPLDATLSIPIGCTVSLEYFDASGIMTARYLLTDQIGRPE